MAFDISGLQEYVARSSREIAMKTIAGAETAKMLIDAGAVQVGVKGSADILRMSNDVTIQSASTCGRTPLGNTVLSTKKITVAPLKEEQDICPKSLYSTQFAYVLSKGQNPQSETFNSEFADKLMNDRAALIASKNEVMLWKGDTGLTAGTDYLNKNKIDGIVKQITTGGTSSYWFVTGVTGSTTVEKLQSFYSKCSVDIRTKEDFRIFIGQDLYDSYLIDLAGKNIFKPVDDKTLFGTTAKIQVVSGLNGTNEIVGGRVSGLHLGIDGEGDSDFTELVYSVETKKWYQDFHYALGVSVIFPSEWAYFKLV